MRTLKQYKVVIIFYLIMLVFTFIVSARVKKLEIKEDYLKYSKDVAMNILN